MAGTDLGLLQQELREIDRERYEVRHCNITIVLSVTWLNGAWSRTDRTDNLP
jgi:hypothetical protein